MSIRELTWATVASNLATLPPISPILDYLSCPLVYVLFSTFFFRPTVRHCSWQFVASSASIRVFKRNVNNGTLINLANPREPSEIIDRIIPMDPNVPVANNLFGAAQGEGSVTLHDLGVNDLPVF